MKTMKILVVDDEAPVREILKKGLSQMGGFSVEVARNGLEAIEKIENDVFDLVLTDVKMPEMDGIELLKIIKGTRPELMVIMMTAYGSIETAVEAMKVGADDYITKPVDFNDLLLHISRTQKENLLLKENRLLRMEVRKKFEFANIIGKSKKMQEIFSLIEKVAPSSSTVIIYGGSGTGKELVAKAIHYHSPRTDKPFIPFNCGAIPETLVESELFGHTKGAFIGATNENLEENMKTGKFREDLFYRLHVFPIFLPDLKDRKEDISLLAYHFLDLCTKETKKQIDGISKEAMNVLLEYDWPGNVRELENVIERAGIISEQTILTASDLPRNLIEGSSALIKKGVKEHKSLDEIKAEYITEILKATEGNKRMAAEILKGNPKTLYRFAKKTKPDLDFY